MRAPCLPACARALLVVRWAWVQRLEALPDVPPASFWRPHPLRFALAFRPPPRVCRSTLHIKTDQYGEKTFTCTDHNCMLE